MWERWGKHKARSTRFWYARQSGGDQSQDDVLGSKTARECEDRLVANGLAKKMQKVNKFVNAR